MIDRHAGRLRGGGRVAVVLRAVFWLAGGALAWTHVGYPLAAAALARVRPRPVRREDVTPDVTVVVAAHDEEDVIGRRSRTCSSSTTRPSAWRSWSPPTARRTGQMRAVQAVASATRASGSSARRAAARCRPRTHRHRARERGRRVHGRERPVGARRAARARASFADPTSATSAAGSTRSTNGTSREGSTGATSSGCGNRVEAGRRDRRERCHLCRAPARTTSSDDPRIGHDLGFPTRWLSGAAGRSTTRPRRPSRRRRPTPRTRRPHVRMHAQGWTHVLSGRMLRPAEPSSSRSSSPTACCAT